MKKSTLTICVITMNRAKQLGNAIESCLKCSLPDDTEFIIVDNGSTDNTETTVHGILSKSAYKYTYHKLPVNMGVGEGRNICYRLSNSEFSYYLDDDAVIDPECYKTFFALPLSVFASNEQVGTITTMIKDPLTSRDPIIARNWRIRQYHCILMYHGGSHFIRNDIFRDRTSLYDQIKYGSEELSPSLFLMNKGLKNIYMPEISIIHCPAINKWQNSSESLRRLTEMYCINQYYIKKNTLPQIFLPFIFIAYKMRIYKYFKTVYIPEERSKRPEITQKYRLRFSTAVKLISEFGIKIF